MSADVLLPTGLVAVDCFREHRTSIGHPECVDRYDAALTGVREFVPDDQILMLGSREASFAELELCHSEEYIKTVFRDCEMGRYTLSTGDTDICKSSFRVAQHAVGGAFLAVGAILEGRVNNAACILRPPGHHAEVDRGMGFCMFNNAALAARYAQRHEGIERVLIADWDVHHGNGTQWIFYDDPSVFYFSTHQWPHYPGTGMASDVGAGAGKGTTMNVPLASGAGRAEVLGAFENKLVPAMREFKPDFVIISAGFDSEAGDPLGGFGLVDRDFEDLTRVMMKIADEHARGRLLSVLEGGYRLEGLRRLFGVHVGTLAAGTAA